MKNYCATLIRACTVLVRLRRAGPAITVAGRCERARLCCANSALALMYSLCTLRFLRSGRTRLKPLVTFFNTLLARIKRREFPIVFGMQNSIEPVGIACAGFKIRASSLDNIMAILNVLRKRSRGKRHSNEPTNVLAYCSASAPGPDCRCLNQDSSSANS